MKMGRAVRSPPICCPNATWTAVRRDRRVRFWSGRPCDEGPFRSGFEISHKHVARSATNGEVRKSAQISAQGQIANDASAARQPPE